MVDISMRYFDESSDDPLRQARLLERVHAAVLGDERSSRDRQLGSRAEQCSPRPVVVESWRRSLAARIDPNGWQPPVEFEASALSEIRATHPLAECVPLLRETLLEAAGDTPHIMIVTDAAGTILWREGNPEICRKADDVLLSEGTRWSEDAIGTNAMGTTLATGLPVRIHSAEHLVCTYHSWTCAASPIHDPETGALLGSIDVSGPLSTVHPALTALVTAAARLAENRLTERMRREHERIRQRHLPSLRALRGEPGALLGPRGHVIESSPGDLELPERIDLDQPASEISAGENRQIVLEQLSEGYLLRAPRRTRSHRVGMAGTARPRETGTGRHELRLRLMSDYPDAELDGVPLRLGLRHAELLAALALRPSGVSSEQLTLLVHGEGGNPGTVRAEIHRLRNQLGHTVVRTKPYRLDALVETDVHSVREALCRGAVRSALAAYGSGLLPDSEAPIVREEQEELAAGLRGAVMCCEHPDPLWSYVGTEQGRDDIEALERLLTLLDPDDWRYARARTRLARLLDEQ
ncbi:GAF domain-containing protein [Actinopolyspora sp. H202]|uniref:GAF domain-containing protein n=1 Tax=Actinopolyspora sp. H202 TaxID=1500456 RepID=UPI003EE502D1